MLNWNGFLVRGLLITAVCVANVHSQTEDTLHHTNFIAHGNGAICESRKSYTLDLLGSVDWGEEDFYGPLYKKLHGGGLSEFLSSRDAVRYFYDVMVVESETDPSKNIVFVRSVVLLKINARLSGWSFQSEQDRAVIIPIPDDLLSQQMGLLRKGYMAQVPLVVRIKEHPGLERIVSGEYRIFPVLEIPTSSILDDPPKKADSEEHMESEVAEPGSAANSPRPGQP